MVNYDIAMHESAGKWIFLCMRIIVTFASLFISLTDWVETFGKILWANVCGIIFSPPVVLLCRVLVLLSCSFPKPFKGEPGPSTVSPLPNAATGSKREGLRTLNAPTIPPLTSVPPPSGTVQSCVHQPHPYSIPVHLCPTSCQKGIEKPYRLMEIHL